jgi:hypothetical protein
MAKLVRVVRINREEARRRLADVPDAKRFWCNDGKIIKNIQELGMSLSNMSDGTYRYHRGGGKNDFSKWVREVIGDAELAEELGRAESPEQAGRVVTKRVSFLESRT